MSSGRDDGRDRREHERTEVRIAVSLRPPSMDGFVDRYIRDISAGGVFIEDGSPPAVGTNIEFRIQAARGDAVISGRGEVMWSRPPSADGAPAGIGVRFIKLDEDSASRLVALASQSPPPPESGEID